MIKRIVLFTALLLPVLIFVFLKFFGKNEFELPVYYTETIPITSSECAEAYPVPYRISNSPLISQGKHTVLAFYDGLSEVETSSYENQLKRLENEFNPTEFELIVVQDSLANQKEKNCVFLMADNRLVLIDSDGRIRGYYKDASLKEVDRLILELQILLKKY
ncbi:MAG: hypothetical protein RIB47_02445 [Cyclobacteriaceae bacterium]